MAGISIHKGAEQGRGAWWQSMRELLRRGPVGDARLDPRSDPFQAMSAAGAQPLPDFSPDFEVLQTRTDYVFRADLPGIHEEDLDVSLADHQLIISGFRREEPSEEGVTWYERERPSGRFHRAFTLPAECDARHVEARLRAGVLTVTVPRGAESHARRIDIKTLAQKLRDRVVPRH